MKKKSKFRKLFPMLSLAVLALVLALLPKLARSAEIGEKAAVLTAVVKMGEVENTLGGGGTLTAEDPVEIEIPATVEIQEFLVDNGDHVEKGQPVAKVDRVTLLSAISEVQKSIDILAEKMLVQLRDVKSTWVQSQAVGRVKAIYAKVGDDAAQVVTDHGALAVVSIDGLMVTRVPTDLPIKAGEALTVRLSDGQEVPARVETRLDDVLTVILSDLEPSVGEEVTVLTKDGAEVGTGILEVHSPWNVIATQGNVGNVVVTQNQMVFAGTRMFFLSFDQGSEEYRSLVTKRRQYEELMEDLFALYTDDSVKAPETGFVTGVDKSILKNTAALDKKPMLKLLADEEGSSDKQDQDQVVNLLIMRVETAGKTTIIRGVPFKGEFPLQDVDKIIEILGNDLIDFTLNEVKTVVPKDYMPKVGDIVIIDKNDPPKKLEWRGENVLEDIKEYIYSILYPEIDYGDFGDYGGFAIGGEAQNDDLFPRQKSNVLAIIPDTSMTVTMSVDELDIPYYELGQKADVKVDALPNRSFTAEVEEISAVGKNSGGNSKFTVKLRLDRAPDMLNGMNASVVVHRGVTSGLVLPAAAVYDRGSQCFVYTAADKKTGTLIGELPVVTGVSDGEMVEIVSGLAEGQVVFYEYYLPVEEGN